MKNTSVQVSSLDCSGLQYSTHAVKRMVEKNISTFEVEETLLKGETIQRYEDDKPFPSRLILFFVGKRPIHVIAAQDSVTKQCIIITCYQPDTVIWNDDFKTKKA